MSVNQTDVKDGRINDELGTQLEALSAQVEAKVERGRNAWAEWQANLSDRTSECLRSIDAEAHSNPWPFVSTAMVFGFLVGTVLGRR
jgi:ElaB/YqjD/DUF883 family membrane-anchored ribosome-binding protein